MQRADGKMRHADRVGILAQIGQLDDLGSVSLAFYKPPQFGEASNQEPTIMDRRYWESANSGTKNSQVFRTPVSCKRCEVPQRKVYNGLELAGKVVGDLQIARCLDVKSQVPELISRLEHP